MHRPSRTSGNAQVRDYGQLSLFLKSYLNNLGSQRGVQSAWPNGAANGLPGRFNPSSDGLFASISGGGQTQAR